MLPHGTCLGTLGNVGVHFGSLIKNIHYREQANKQQHGYTISNVPPYFLRSYGGKLYTKQNLKHHLFTTLKDIKIKIHQSTSEKRGVIMGHPVAERLAGWIWNMKSYSGWL